MIPLYAAVFLIYFLDRLTKVLALTLLKPGESVPVIKNIFYLTLTSNTGAAFGMLKSIPWFFTGVTITVCVLICFFLALKFKELTRAERFSFAMVLAGALGNLVDRLRFGSVIDFLDFRVWPVFNVADSFITIGTCLLAVTVILHGRKNK